MSIGQCVPVQKRLRVTWPREADLQIMRYGHPTMALSECSACREWCPVLLVLLVLPVLLLPADFEDR